VAWKAFVKQDAHRQQSLPRNLEGSDDLSATHGGGSIQKGVEVIPGF
jgi:hypothetical protein